MNKTSSKKFHINIWCDYDIIDNNKNAPTHVDEEGCLVVYLDLLLQSPILSRFENKKAYVNIWYWFRLLALYLRLLKYIVIFLLNQFKKNAKIFFFYNVIDILYYTFNYSRGNYFTELRITNHKMVGLKKIMEMSKCTR